MSEAIDENKDGQACNLDYLLVNLGRNRAAAERLIRIFLENYPQLVARLERAAADHDILAMQDAAHDIRSSCVLFSAHQTVALARELEYMLYCHRRDGVQVDWLSRSGRLRDSLSRVRAELLNYLGEGSGAVTP
ncbi:Hpt domain-containing protein [Azonexus sp.]|uniref:Hpt domain-containing protein n=1 Tax=Azonexus sp. TaxID=1872668 RepID=UPI0035AE2E8E